MASERARALAEQFERVNDDLIATVERCTAEQWRATCADTGWSVAVQADHLANGEAFIAERVGQIARGEAAPPLPLATIEQANEQRAAQAADVGRDEVIAMLRRNGATAAQMIRDLDEEQLGRTGQIVVELPVWSVEQWIENLSIGELERHGGAIRQAVGG